MNASNTSISVHYELISSEQELEGHRYQSWGIRLCYAGVQVEVPDLSLERAAVEELVRRCNRGQLSPIHFQEVLQDFLAH